MTATDTPDQAEATLFDPAKAGSASDCIERWHHVE